MIDRRALLTAGVALGALVAASKFGEACTMPAGLLNDGLYLVAPRVAIHGVRWIAHDDVAISFEVHRDAGDSPYAMGNRSGAVAPILPWCAM